MHQLAICAWIVDPRIASPFSPLLYTFQEVIKMAVQTDWETTIARVTPAIVSIRVCSVRSHEVDCSRSQIVPRMHVVTCSLLQGVAANYSYATGFVVDRQRGIILTNRHVVTTGPVTMEAVFSNKEEVCAPAGRPVEGSFHASPGRRIEGLTPLSLLCRSPSIPSTVILSMTTPSVP